jgi:hypothetical protein
MLAVGRDHVTPPLLRLQTVFAHQPAQLLAVHDHALVHLFKGDEQRSDQVSNRSLPRAAKQLECDEAAFREKLRVIAKQKRKGDSKKERKDE